MGKRSLPGAHGRRVFVASDRPGDQDPHETRGGSSFCEEFILAAFRAEVSSPFDQLDAALFTLAERREFQPGNERLR